ncbi:hypothetical protein GQX74_001426 [Glossina fuscipes]|nr:hypothetical protein GQX74_001426 [Glossina fuscipes]
MTTETWLYKQGRNVDFSAYSTATHTSASMLTVLISLCSPPSSIDSCNPCSKEKLYLREQISRTLGNQQSFELT